MLVTKFTKLNTIGDTIIEVMIALSVLGMALGVSYATANKALLGTRDAQEHTEALKWAEDQLEKIRALRPTVPASPFCINSSNTVAGPCTQGLYLISDQFDSTTDIYTVTVTWEKVTGSSVKNQLTLNYKLH